MVGVLNWCRNNSAIGTCCTSRADPYFTDWAEDPECGSHLFRSWVICSEPSNIEDLTVGVDEVRRDCGIDESLGLAQTPKIDLRTAWRHSSLSELSLSYTPESSRQLLHQFSEILYRIELNAGNNQYPTRWTILFLSCSLRAAERIMLRTAE
jgi:hypothetical protein